MSRSVEPKDLLGLNKTELVKAETAWEKFSAFTMKEAVKPCAAHRIETLKESTDQRQDSKISDHQ